MIFDDGKHFFQILLLTHTVIFDKIYQIIEQSMRE